MGIAAAALTIGNGGPIGDSNGMRAIAFFKRRRRVLTAKLVARIRNTALKALVLVEYGRFEIRDLPTPKLGPHDVLVAVKACGICGSDVHGMDGSTGRRQPPIVMGHEAAGTVADRGSAVSDLEIGEAVAFDSMISCGWCSFCAAGRPNLCDRRRVLGVACDEFRCEGAFAEYVAVPRRIVHRLPEGLSFEHAALAEPVSVALHAVGRLSLRLGDCVVVVGAGMIGQLVVQLLKRSGCAPVLAIEPDERRRRLACELGADDCYAPGDEKLSMRLSKATFGRGADAAADCVGVPETVATAIRLVRKGGTVALVGNLTSSAVLPLQSVVTREISLLGCCASAVEYPVALRLLADRVLCVEPLISAVVPLEDAPQWFARLRDGSENLMKVVVRPDL